MTRSISRRRFLALLSSTALLAGCAETDAPAQSGSQPSAAPPSAAPQEHEIVVIGAGMAGIAAAAMLREEGRQVLVLEGRERIGGRIWTSRELDGLSLDLGASWIQGTEDNPLTELAEELDVETVETDDESFLLYDSDGSLVEDAEVEQLEAWADEIIDELSTERNRRQKAGEDDVGLDVVFEDFDDFDEREQRGLRFVLNTLIEHEYATDLEDLSLYHWDQDSGFGGGQVLFPEGYVQLIDGLTEGLTIRTGTVVQRISYDDAGVTISTSAGSYRAERAIVTLPLGVLKAGSVEFDPPLPQKKRDAIERLGMGVLNKLYLRFPEQFWEDEHLFGYVPEEHGRWTEWVNLEPALGEPVLFCFNAGSYARELEDYDDEEIVAEGMAVLRTIFGDEIPDPDDWLISRWGSDPFALGSYSHLSPGATADDYDALAKPVQNRLFFAGEATNSEYPATVHGAMLSGWREAERILEK